jgi:putative PIN family toxin of toxin-antitoxin system
VIDTVVFVRALLNPHSKSGRLLFEMADRYTIIVSKPTAQEALEVIKRPELTRKNVIYLVSQAEAVEIDTPPPVVRDPKDDIFVATAIAGQADYIVSEDKDLLSLGKSVGVEVIDTRTFLALISD